MPCRSYSPEDEKELLRAKKAKRDQKTKKVIKDLNLATRLLCEICRDLDPEDMSPQLKKWWKRHEVCDAKRRTADEARRAKAAAKAEAKAEKKKLKASAVAKLTAEELEALGL